MLFYGNCVRRNLSVSQAAQNFAVFMAQSLGVLGFMRSVEVSKLIDAPCRMLMRPITKNLQRLKFAFICQKGCPLPSQSTKTYMHASQRKNSNCKVQSQRAVPIANCRLGFLLLSHASGKQVAMQMHKLFDTTRWLVSLVVHHARNSRGPPADVQRFRNGGGPGSVLLMGISLALLQVPQGKPMCHATTRAVFLQVIQKCPCLVICPNQLNKLL